ncbi:DNA mismatch repair protein MutS [Stratiformator vulcanicus]|uniref:DNA mismatch repair protein MutS n=1 Tax=Stratiformator vulcanicus TaxID=2527980 RepID=A0A517QVY8_9PLAN|nr:DNA mismatch repair protein MutS [Stratiformator vulcanicus]QDT35822.1 DNA mismatch repair protein MutS [Stratiformator vulcanicus]
MPKLTPMMQRYQEVKRENPEALLLFRMGDFYELFYEDAEVAAKSLGLTLTSRDKNSDNPVPMAGFPYHALRPHLQKLIRQGFRVAVCEQVEDPKTAKGMVKREVTQVVTPGTLTDDDLLDPRESNFLCALHADKSGTCGLAWIDISTGRFVAADLPEAHVIDELARLDPSEVLISEEQPKAVVSVRQQWEGTPLYTPRQPWSFGNDESRRLLNEHFGTATLEGFDLDDAGPGVTAAGALLDYVRETQKTALGHITIIEPHRRGERLIIDEATRRSLELTRTIRDGERAGSLLAVIDETVTSMGARLLADWLSGPLTDVKAINARLDAVEELRRETALCRNVREQLDEAYDLERLTGRVATGRTSPKDLVCLGKTLALLPKLKAKLSGRGASLLNSLEAKLDLCPEVRTDIEKLLVEDPPLLTSEGNMIRPGVDTRLDELRELARGGKAWIAKYQAKQSERTGIPNLKVGFNKVFGYYLEVTAAHRDKVPDDFIRKQTLKNQERYITPELKEYEDKVLGAEEKAIALEQQLFDALKTRVAEYVPRLQQTSVVLASLDVLAGLATLAGSRDYCRPEMTDEPVLDITDGRHPVLDRLRPSGEFVPNDIHLGGEHEAIVVLTGPNMAGKSTYIRQSALLTILAQLGSFVPATSATIGVADRVFARVGASDDVGRGQSTFMVEMTETARILHAATKRSLVILDEIGRGTSTYDGLSLAWSVTEYLHDSVDCRTLFATHYHELTDLPKSLSRAGNWHVAVHEADGEITFLHKIVRGATNRSYGLHVASLAGVPKQVVDRADQILESLEAEPAEGNAKRRPGPKRTRKEKQIPLFATEEHPMISHLRELDVDAMTPLEALQEIARIRERLRSE